MEESKSSNNKTLERSDTEVEAMAEVVAEELMAKKAAEASSKSKSNPNSKSSASSSGISMELIAASSALVGAAGIIAYVMKSMSFPSSRSSSYGGILFYLAIQAGCLAGLAILGAIGYYKLLDRIQYIGSNEQLLVKQLTRKIVINGPAVYFPSFVTTLSYKKRKGLSLNSNQYVRVQDSSDGNIRIIRGPASVQLGPYDELTGGAAPLAATVLSESQGIVVVNSKSGHRRLVTGPRVFTPGAFDQILEHKNAIALHQSQFVRIEDTLAGSVRVERGEQVLWLSPHERQIGPVREAWVLSSHQYVRLRDKLTGATRVERGEQMVFPGPHEESIDKPSPVLSAIDLSGWEYCCIQDQSTGATRVERGEKLVWLAGTERILGNEKEQAVIVDTQHAVLVRNRQTGVQRLVEEPQLFVPADDEEVVEVRPLIKLAEHEAVILKDHKGEFDIRFGDPDKGTARAFFLPPNYELVTQRWSRGRRRERRDLSITVFDTRPQYMSFEFNCRTSDNVEMILEGTFFWEVQDLGKMIKFTGDASGDVCSHARSCFIQLISKVTLKEFMFTFNEIARQAHSADDSFYRARGINIHSLEVTRYQCADKSTAQILEKIIQETTNRLNRLSCQESENEVQLAKLHGQVEQEKAKAEVLEIQQHHAVEAARAEGLADAEKCVAFLQHIKKLDEGSDDGAQLVGGGKEAAKLGEELWHALRKNEALQAVSQGNAHVYFTPADANLSIEAKA